MKTALLVSNTTWNFKNFRLPLARALKRRGWRVIFVAPRQKDDPYVDGFKQEGFEFIAWRLKQHSANPLTEAFSLAHLASIYLRTRPNLVHHFTLKPVLYGSISIRLARLVQGSSVVVVNTITGLGKLFLGEARFGGWLHHLVVLLLRRVLAASGMVAIFQNPSDLEEALAAGWARSPGSFLVPGSGVDPERFRPSSDEPTEPTVLFPARVLRDKGIGELAGALAILKSRGKRYRAWVAGAREPSHPSCVPESEWQHWLSDGLFEYLGEVSDIERLIAQCSVVALPSYREGLPRSLLEAGACAKPSVTTDVPGCRDLVLDGVNGLVVPPKNPERLADALDRCLSDPKLSAEMGERARQRILDRFTDQAIVAQILGIYGQAGIAV
jgi:glycosyltransferase involved in cell wall biosynthesis